MCVEDCTTHIISRDLHKSILSQGLQIGNEIGDQFQNQSFTNYIGSLSSVILTSNYLVYGLAKQLDRRSP